MSSKDSYVAYSVPDQFRSLAKNLSKLYKTRDFTLTLIGQHEAELRRLGKVLEQSDQLEGLLQEGGNK
jgi:hypothetical protein